MIRSMAISVLSASFLVPGLVSEAIAEEARADISLPVLQASTHQRLQRLAESNPTEFFQYALREYRNRVRDYTCTFEKQEVLQGKMTKKQVISVKFKEPFAVFMKWVRNPSLVDRVLYVKGRNDDKALIKPAGILGWLVPTHVKRKVNGPDSKRASRRPLDKFGFANAIQLVLDVNRQAAKANELWFRYKGTGMIDGRPTWVFERRLPNKPCYPDQRLLVHVDQQWLVPTALYCYDVRNNLLGCYVYRDVTFNLGMTDKDFTARANGL